MTEEFMNIEMSIEILKLTGLFLGFLSFFLVIRLIIVLPEKFSVYQNKNNFSAENVKIISDAFSKKHTLQTWTIAGEKHEINTIFNSLILKIREEAEKGSYKVQLKVYTNLSWYLEALEQLKKIGYKAELEDNDIFIEWNK